MAFIARPQLQDGNPSVRAPSLRSRRGRTAVARSVLHERR